MDMIDVRQQLSGKLAALVVLGLAITLQLFAVETVLGDDGQSGGPNEILLVPGVMNVGEYGFGWGSGIHQGGLVATFDSTGEALTFSVTGYDIDSNTEVRVLLNGEELGYLSTGADKGLNGGDTFLLQAQAQKVGLNEIQFVTKRPNRVWGVD